MTRPPRDELIVPSLMSAIHLELESGVNHLSLSVLSLVPLKLYGLLPAVTDPRSVPPPLIK